MPANGGVMELLRSPYIALAALLMLLVGCGDDASVAEPQSEPDAVLTQDTDNGRAVSTDVEVPAPDTEKVDVYADDSESIEEVEASDASEATDIMPPQPDISEPVEPVEPGPESIDCANIPQGPFELVKLNGPMASEDLAFDREGHLIGSNDNAIFKSVYGGQPQVFVPNINFRAGLRYLPSG